MILPALSAGLTSDSPAITLGRPPVSTGMIGATARLANAAYPASAPI
jgi:hypothetical protein